MAFPVVGWFLTAGWWLHGYSRMNADRATCIIFWSLKLGFRFSQGSYAWNSTHYLLFCSSQDARELMYCRLSMAWRRTSYCLQSPEVVDLNTFPVKVSDDWNFILIEGIFFFKWETPKLLTVHILEGARVYFSMTRDRIEIWHISSLTFSFSCPLKPKLISMGISWLGWLGRL